MTFKALRNMLLEKHQLSEGPETSSQVLTATELWVLVLSCLP